MSTPASMLRTRLPRWPCGVADDSRCRLAKSVQNNQSLSQMITLRLNSQTGRFASGWAGQSSDRRAGVLVAFEHVLYRSEDLFHIMNQFLDCVAQSLGGRRRVVIDVSQF